MRAVLALFAICIVAPATLAIGGLVVWNVFEVRRSKEAELLAVARSASKTVDLRISRVSTIADAVATADAVVGKDWEATRRRIERLALGPDVWIAITDGQGRRLLNTLPAYTEPQQSRLPRPADIEQALRTSRPAISDLFTGWTSGRKVVAVSQAVRGSPDRIVVTVVTDPAAVLPTTGELSVPYGATITLVDRRYRVMARSRNQERWQGAASTPSMIRSMQQQSEGVVPSRSLEGDPTVVAYTRSPLTGWTTMVVVPRQTLMALVLRNAFTFAILSAALLAFGLALSRIFGKGLIGELHRLEMDAAQLGRGGIVEPRDGRVENINQVQTSLSVASKELEARASRQTLMLNELNHRVKNTLATVQSLSLHTFRSPGPEAPSKFDKRLAALADAHDLLTHSSWEPLDIRTVVERCARAASDNVAWSGPSEILPAQAAVALCMCLHELLTNAMKYGALSIAGGRASITWARTADGKIDLEWREQGGPPVTPPSHKGFGARLIDRLSRAELGGEIVRDYAPEGLTVRLRIAPPAAERWSNRFG